MTWPIREDLESHSATCGDPSWPCPGGDVIVADDDKDADEEEEEEGDFDDLDEDEDVEENDEFFDGGLGRLGSAVSVCLGNSSEGF